MKKLILVLLVLFLGCVGTLVYPEKEDDVDIVVTKTGGDHGNIWERGYVINNMDITIENVKVDLWTIEDSETVGCEPTILTKGQKGIYISSSLRGHEIFRKAIYTKQLFK